MENSVDVSIIIVNYNTKELTRKCLKSVFEQTKNISFEVIVSDNGSKDGSVEIIKAEFPQVILIENNANLGFGAANNRGLKIANGKYIFYLNSDTVLLNNAVKIFFDYWENSPKKEKIGALGANLLDRDGNVTHSCGRFPTFGLLLKILIRDICSQTLKLILKLVHFEKENKVLRLKKTVYFEKTGFVDYITGADLFLLNNNDAYFDENFILYYEEVDLEYKLAKKQKQRVLIDTPKIVHLEGAGKKKEFTSFGNLMSYISMVYYCKKNMGIIRSNILRILVCILWANPMYIKETRRYYGKLFVTTKV